MATILDSKGEEIRKRVYHRWAKKSDENSRKSPQEVAALILKAGVEVVMKKMEGHSPLGIIITKDKRSRKLIHVLCLKIHEEDGKETLAPLARLFTEDDDEFLDPPSMKPKGELE